MNGFCDTDARVNCVDRLARIEQMLKDRFEQVSQERERIEDFLFRHEYRISALEKWRNWMLGACGVLVSLAAGVGEWLRNHLRLQL